MKVTFDIKAILNNYESSQLYKDKLSNSYAVDFGEFIAPYIAEMNKILEDRHKEYGVSKDSVRYTHEKMLSMINNLIQTFNKTHKTYSFYDSNIFFTIEGIYTGIYHKNIDMAEIVSPNEVNINDKTYASEYIEDYIDREIDRGAEIHGKEVVTVVKLCLLAENVPIFRGILMKNAL